MLTKTRYYLYRFKLFINNILIPSCPDGPMQITWKSPQYSHTYSQSSYFFKDSEAKIQTEIYLEDVLVKEDVESSFMSLESEISIEQMGENGMECVASLKIDLHDLAMSDHFNEIKTLSMFSPVSQDSWIGIGLAGIQFIEISDSEALGFTHYDHLTVPMESAHLRKSSASERRMETSRKRKNRQKSRTRENYGMIMKLIAGKDSIIEQLEEKAVYLIGIVKQTQLKLSQVEKQRISKRVSQELPSEIKSDRSRSVSNRKPSSRRELSVKNISVVVKQPSVKEKDNVVFAVPDEKSKICLEEEIDKVETVYKEIIKELQGEIEGYKEKIHKLESNMEQLQQAKTEIYETKKKSILINQQNQLLRKNIQDLQFQLSVQSHNQFQQIKAITEKSENRLLTCASVEDDQWKMESEIFKIKEKTLTEQIEKLRVKLRQSNMETFNLKRKESQMTEKSATPPRNYNSNVEDVLRVKMIELSTKYAEAQQENRTTIFKLQSDLSILTQEKRTLERQHDTLIKKSDYLKQQLESLKESNHQNEKKLVSLNRMENKNKELEEFNKKLQQTIQKQEGQLREKHKQLLEFSYSRGLPTTRLKEERVESGEGANETTNQIKKKSSFPSYNARRSELRSSILEMGVIIKDNKEKLDNAVSNEETGMIQIHERTLKDSKEKMKILIEELNVVEEEPSTPRGGFKNELGNRWQAQLILQENNELKVYVKSLLKKVVALETITPMNKLDLVLKEREITQNQRMLLESIEDILAETSSNQSIEKESYINNVSHIKQLYSKQSKIVQQQLKRIFQYNLQLMELQTSLNKREEKLNIIEHMSTNKRLQVILPENKWKESDLAEYAEVKRKEKELKIKVNTLESKALNDKMEFDKEKQEIIKKSKEEQKRLIHQTKEANDKQLNNWKLEMAELERRLREREIEVKELNHSIQLSKTTLENEQRMNNMRISEHNLKTHDMSNSIEEITQQLKNEMTKNRFSLETIKELNGNINRMTAAAESRQSQYQHLEQQYRQFRQESEDLVLQMDAKHKEMENRMREEHTALEYQTQRLKLLVEDEVIKSVKFEDEYKVVCETINQLQREIEELNLRLDQKEEVIGHMNEREMLKVAEVRVMEEEYNKVLMSLAEENQRYALLKGEYTSLELMQEKAEEFIYSMETSKEEDRRHFEEILDERDKEKRSMINQINDMLRTHGEREIEYRKNVNEFELHILKIQEQLEVLKNNETRLEQENEALTKEREDLRIDNGSLLEELERYGKRDKKKKKAGFTAIEVPPYATNQSLMQGSKGDVEKEPSYAGSGNEVHKASSVEFEHGRGQHEQLFTPNSPYDRGSPPNMDEASQHQFLYPSSQRSNRTFNQNQDSNLQIKITDANGEEVMNRGGVGRSGSVSGKTKFYPKSEPLEEVYEQSIEKQSKEHSKDYEKSVNNDSDEDSDERKEEIENLQKIIEALNKELAEKRLIILELEAINKKNQFEMMETKKYLESSLKRKGTYRRSLKDVDMHSPLNSDVKEVKEDNITESLKEIENMGEQMDVLEEELRAEKQLNLEYEEHMKEMKEELLMQEADHEKLIKVVDEMQEEINDHKSKELELYGEVQKLLAEMDIKNGLITEFEEVIKGKEEEKQHSEKIIGGLEVQLVELLKYKERLEAGLEETSEELVAKEKEVLRAQALREQLSKKIEQLSDELFQARQELDGKNTLISQCQSLIKQRQVRIEELESDIESMADKYLSIQEFMAQQKEELNSYGEKFKQSGEKHEDTIKRLVNVERQKGLLELEIKELHNSISLKEKTIAQIQERAKELESEMVKQASMFERERGEMDDLEKQLGEELKNREMNIEALKNDVQIILKENQRLKDEKEKARQEETVSDEQVKNLVKSFEIEIGMEKTKMLVLQEEIRELNKTIDSQKNEIEELTQMENLRGSLIEEVEKNNRQTIVKLESELRVINEQIQKRNELQAEQLRFQYEEKLALKDRDYCQLKIQYDKEKKAMEEERYEMFSRKCELEETRISMAEKEEDYKHKIQKYEGSIKEICGKLRNIETERPHIELFEEVSFQNEIFRNRITELEEIVSFKETVNNEYYIQELETMKAKFMVERQEYMNELENYAAQVTQLEDKNYQLSSELQQMKYDDYNELKEENMELEKSITRLETCEEELRREVQLLKGKREEEYKKYLADLRALRTK